MIPIHDIRGKRQRERAQHIVKQLNDPEKARWLQPDNVCLKTILMLGNDLQTEALKQWIKDDTLKAGTNIKLVIYQQDCNCPGGFGEEGRKRCQGHEQTLSATFSGHRCRWYLDEWKNSATCNGVCVYLDDVNIGNL